MRGKKKLEREGLYCDHCKLGPEVFGRDYFGKWEPHQIKHRENSEQYGNPGILVVVGEGKYQWDFGFGGKVK